MIARVLPDVTGLDKTFDYLVPDGMDGVAVGDAVRVELHGRRVGGWVVAFDPPDAHHAGLKPIAKWSSRGPAADILELSEWAAIRWAGRRRHFLNAAAPDRNVERIPASRRTGATVEPRSPASTRILAAGGGGVLRLPPTSDPMPAVLSGVALGSTLVVVPGVEHASLLAARLRRSGLTVALIPDDWALAAAGVDVVIGARRAAWAPCPDLAVAVVLDEHDEALQEEGSPTWHARDVVIERCRRSSVPVLLVSPCPTLTALEWGPLTRPPHARERAGWPIVDVVDRSDEEPWKRSLVTSRLIQLLREPQSRVICISNTTGRAALLACRSCRELTRCERCDAAVIQTADGRLVCLRCDTVRPPVCSRCGGGRFANLRPGVARLREELEAAAGRPVALVTGTGWEGRDDAGVVVGTEAALHRVDRADTVAFLDFDRELLSPRYRAGEQALALLARAARLVGPRERGGRILIQTFVPRHEVIDAALLADPGRLADVERERRRMLRLPPFGAYAEISGVGSDGFVRSLPASDSVLVAGSDESYVARADDWMTLGALLDSGERPPGSRLRIAVDPPR